MGLLLLGLNKSHPGPWPGTNIESWFKIVLNLI
jgi:hypothetical protein